MRPVFACACAATLVAFIVGLLATSCVSFEGLTGGSGADGSAAPQKDSSAVSDAGSDVTLDAQAAPPEDAAASRDAGNTSAEASSYAARVLGDAPIGYWRLDETSGTVAHDSSGHGHDGTYGSNVVLGQPGLVGDGFSATFDGSQDAGASHFVRIPEDKGLEPASWVTFECWALPAAGDATASLVSYGSDGPTPFEPYVLWMNAGVPQAYVVAGANGVPIAAPQALSAGKHHLAAVYDGASLRLFVDGLSVASAGATGSLSNYDAVNGLGIGSGFSATRETFPGAIDEVAIYDNPLTPKQIHEHYAAGLAH